MKKKFTILLAGVIALSSFAVGAMSKNIVEKIEAEIRGDFTVVIDGKQQTFRDVNGNIVDPILYDGTTYLPIRAIGEIMGKTVYWYQDEKKIELVTPSEEEVLVTDADVIITAGDERVKPEKNDKATVNAEITLDEAKAIALKKAGLKEAAVTFTKAKLDNDDGRLVYEIDFITDTAKYDAEVDAVSGNVIEWEVEEKTTATKVTNVTTEAEITLDEAKEIALKKAGLKETEVTFTKAKLEHDDGRRVYKIEFVKDRLEYEAEIDAKTGAVIEWEADGRYDHDDHK